MIAGKVFSLIYFYSCYFLFILGALRRYLKPSRLIFNAKLSTVQTEEWSLFPREREGNIYSVNWSLCEDGVVPVGDAYRNARLPILTNRLGVKVQNGKIAVEKPVYFGKYTILEAGDHISHDDFSEIFATQQEYLSSGIELFVEDGAFGVNNLVRNGARVTTNDPALALIARTMLVIKCCLSFILILMFIIIGIGTYSSSRSESQGEI